MEKELAEEILNAIVQQANRMIGPVALAQLKNVKEIKIVEGRVKVSHNGKTINRVIEEYQKIMKMGARGIVVMAVADILKKHPDKTDEIKKELPEWVFEHK